MPPPARESFPSYPPCCRRCLMALADEGKAGSRNCERGHTVNLARAREVEARRAAAGPGSGPGHEHK